jgi:hypothetical protein
MCGKNASATETPEKTYVAAATQAAPGDRPSDAQRTSTPMPAAAQCRIGKIRTASGSGSGASSARTGYNAPAFGFGARGRPPETSGVQTGILPRAHASCTLFSSGRL